MPAPALPIPYLASPTAGALWQCEILGPLILMRRNVEAMAAGKFEVSEETFDLGVLVSQGCDLEQDFEKSEKYKDLLKQPRPEDQRGAEEFDKVLAKERPNLPNLLFCQILTAEMLYSQGKNEGSIPSKDIWKRIARNKDERYHFLESIPPDADTLKHGLPEMAIDFKRYFSLPTEEVYKRIEIGETKRRCVLSSPYLEHLSTRFAYYMSRVALPTDHTSD